MCDNQVLVSVIIPLYNSEKCIYDALLSIRGQTYENIEVIIIDDGSTDSSGIIADEFCQIDQRFHCYHISNAGVSNARNIGIKKATGEKIYFMDSDDIIESTMLENLLTDYHNYDLVICGLIIEELQKNESKHISVPERDVIGYNDIRSWLSDININTKGIFLDYIWNKIFDASIIRNNSIEFDTTINLGEDFLFVSEYVKHISSLRIINKCLYHYFIRNQMSLVSKFDINEFHRRRCMR